MAHTHGWNSSFEATPADTDDASEGALRIRNTREAVRERLASDHYMALSGTNNDHGKHQVVTFVDNGAEPANPSGNQRIIWNNGGVLSVKDGSGNTTRLGSIPSGTKMVFKQSSVPFGWTFKSEDDDRGLINTATESEGGDTGGSWTISGLSVSVSNHTLTQNEIPNFSGSWQEKTNNGEYQVWNTTGIISVNHRSGGYKKVNSRGSNSNYMDTVSINFGGGQGHNHGSNISQNGTWRFAYVKVITGEKD